MIALVQRVKKAEVTVNSKSISRISFGICILLGISEADTQEDIEYLVNRTISLKWFASTNTKFEYNFKSFSESNTVAPEILVVSQFTLYADLKKGTKPSFTKAKNAEEANKMYLEFCNKLSALGYTVKRGEFGAYMAVELINDGPATFILSSDHLKHHDSDRD